MGRVFLRKQFSNYLGENRSILDINASFIPNTPTPTPTSSSIPLTQTPTPSITPTQSPFPVCPSQINITVDPSLGTEFSAATGTYNRLFTYSGGSFNSGWVSRTSGADWNFFTGAFSGDSKDYVLYALNDGVQYYVFVWSKNTTALPRYYLLASTGNYFMNGSVVDGALQYFTNSSLPESGGFVYPLAGPYGLYNYLSYPSSCPTPTPTNTPTKTPTNTPTKTPTNTPTKTPTNTPTPSSTPAPSLDPDAVAYLSAVISAGGTVDATMSAATDALFVSLKSGNVYSKLTAFYPILGGTQSSHAVDGKTPGSPQTLTFYGSWTHDIKGMQPVCNTSNYADTQYLPTSLNANSNHMFGYYNRVGSCGASTYDGAGPSPYFILGHPAVEFFCSNAVISAGGTFTNYGSVLGTRTASNVTKLFRSLDGGSWGLGGSNASAPSTYPSNSITIAKVNGSGFPSGERYAFFSFGDGLSDAEATNYYNAVLAFQTTLGRNTNL